MKKLIVLLIAISLVACSSQKKTTHKDITKYKADRYQDYNGFQKSKHRPIFTGW